MKRTRFIKESERHSVVPEHKLSKFSKEGKMQLIKCDCGHWTQEGQAFVHSGQDQLRLKPDGSGPMSFAVLMCPDCNRHLQLHVPETKVVRRAK